MGDGGKPTVDTRTKSAKCRPSESCKQNRANVRVRPVQPDKRPRAIGQAVRGPETLWEASQPSSKTGSSVFAVIMRSA